MSPELGQGGQLEREEGRGLSWVILSGPPLLDHVET